MSYQGESNFLATFSLNDLRKIITEIFIKESKPIIEAIEAKVKAQKEQDDERPMSISEVSKYFNVTKATIHNWMNDGKLSKGVKIGKNRYFHLSELKTIKLIDVTPNTGSHEI